MIRIGILGDIGSGKSYIANQFGYPVFNADAEVKKIYKKNKKCFKKLKKKFSKDIVSFPIKKKELFRVIKKNKNNIKKINKIVHPEVRLSMKNFIKKNIKKKAVILDIPLLLEENINKKKDVLIFVQASRKEIYKRLKKRKNFNLDVYNKLKKHQFNEKFKKKKSTFIIRNDFKPLTVKKKIQVIRNKILNK